MTWQHFARKQWISENPLLKRHSRKYNISKAFKKKKRIIFKKNLQHFRKHFLAFEILQKYYKKHKMRKNQTFQKTVTFKKTFQWHIFKTQHWNNDLNVVCFCFVFSYLSMFCPILSYFAPQGHNSNSITAWIISLWSLTVLNCISPTR